MNEQLKQGLCDMLAFIEANDDFNFEESSQPTLVELNISTWWFNDRSDADRKHLLADLLRRIGKATKTYGHEFVNIEHPFGSRVKLYIATQRHVVCERVVIGTEVIPEHVIPAQDERVIPERVIEKIEWRCAPILAGDQETVGV